MAIEMDRFFFKKIDRFMERWGYHQLLAMVAKGSLQIEKYLQILILMKASACFWPSKVTG